MWPWGHLAVGYVCYSVFVHIRRKRGPDGWGALAAAFGTQFPDLIDKPLAWSFHLLPSGRSLAHSLLTATLVLVAVHLHWRRRGRSHLTIPFAVGYLSHLAGDAIGPLIDGEYAYLSFLGWPLLPPPPYGDEGGFLSHVAAIEPTPWFLAQLGFALAAATLLWVLDGTPGLAGLRALADRTDRTSERDR